MMVEIPDIIVKDDDNPMKVLRQWRKEFFVRGRHINLNKDGDECVFVTFFKGSQARVVLDAGRGMIKIVPQAQIEDANMPTVRVE